jgi:uncharacterized membrane protein
MSLTSMLSRIPIIALFVLSGCNVVEIEDYPCPQEGTELTYENFGASFLAANCGSCHAAASTDRQGAPPNYVFDSLEQVRTHKARIFARSATTNVSMPPGPDDPPEVGREKLAEWLACGAP